MKEKRPTTKTKRPYTKSHPGLYDKQLKEFMTIQFLEDCDPHAYYEIRSRIEKTIEVMKAWNYRKLDSMEAMRKIYRLFEVFWVGKEAFYQKIIEEDENCLVPENSLEEQAKKLASEREPLGPPPPRKGGKSEVRH
jgi:hypothetical protein